MLNQDHKENKCFNCENSTPQNLPGNSLAVYTVLFVLKTMKKELGLEAMLQYLEKYLEIIECDNPALPQAVAAGIRRVNLQNIYYDAMNG